MNIMRKAGAAVALTGSLLLAGGALAGPAAAAPPAPRQDGLINVTIGDVTVLQDINAAVIAAVNVCGVSVKNVAILAEIVDNSGQTRTVCRAADGPVIFSQN